VAIIWGLLIEDFYSNALGNEKDILLCWMYLIQVLCSATRA